jgi:hypothetical protein
MSTLDIWTLDKPHQNLAPQGFVTQIGDHMLLLPQQLEPFENEKFGEEIIASLTLDTSAARQKLSDEENKFTSHWVNYIGHSMASLYLSKIFEISGLSESGALQLEQDIGYLTNILSLLGVDVNEQLNLFKKYVAISKGKYQEMLMESSMDEQTHMILTNIGTKRTYEKIFVPQ